MYEPGPLWPKTQSDHCRLYVHTLSGPQELGQMPPCLRAHECRVFIVPLAAMAASLLELRAVLSSEERRRADGFHFVRDAAMFVVIHGVLRHLLAYRDADWRKEDGFVVMYTGAHGPANDLKTALDAASRLKESEPSVRFVFVGSGKEKIAHPPQAGCGAVCAGGACHCHG